MVVDNFNKSFKHLTAKENEKFPLRIEVVLVNIDEKQIYEFKYIFTAKILMGNQHYLKNMCIKNNAIAYLLMSDITKVKFATMQEAIDILCKKRSDDLTKILTSKGVINCDSIITLYSN